MLARKTWPTRIWMATGKKVYYAITRGINFTDREGRGHAVHPRSAGDRGTAPAHPQVRDVAIVAYPDRHAGTGLYAFVEGSIRRTGAARASQRRARWNICRSSTPCRAMPQGGVRNEILELVALNQLDLIGSLVKTDAERAIVARIVSDRRNLRDRFASDCLQPAIRAGLRAARQISHCRRHGAMSDGANGSLRSKRSSHGRTSATGRNAGSACGGSANIAACAAAR